MVTGASGLLGSNCLLLLDGISRRFGLCHQHEIYLPGVMMWSVDLLSQTARGSAFKDVKPDLVIHCAALTDVDYCEQYPDRAVELNCNVSAQLANATAESGCDFVYISTDAVYGLGKGFFSEDDHPEPVNEYGRSKLQGEWAVLNANARSLVLRTCIYGWNAQEKYSFSEAILKSLVLQQDIFLFKDVTFSPILVNDLLDVIIQLLEIDANGIYNVGSPTGVSKLAFGQILAEKSGLASKYIKPIVLAEKELQAVRPLNPTMDVSKVSMALGHKLPTVEEGIDRFLELLTNGYVEQLKPGVKTLQQLKKVWQ